MREAVSLRRVCVALWSSASQDCKVIKSSFLLPPLDHQPAPLSCNFSYVLSYDVQN